MVVARVEKARKLKTKGNKSKQKLRQVNKQLENTKAMLTRIRPATIGKKLRNCKHTFL